jgi:hypothetical protein
VNTLHKGDDDDDDDDDNVWLSTVRESLRVKDCACRT